jgi:hypothetical protein
MSRIIFIISLIIVLIIGRVLQVYQVPVYGLIVIMIGSLVVIARRIFLKMTPWWDSKLRDIPKYFQRP